MGKISLRSLCFCAVLLCFSVMTASSGNCATEDNQRIHQQTISVIEQMLRAGYAPVEWKKEHFGWRLDEELRKLRVFVAARHLTMGQFHSVVNQFFKSSRDTHTFAFFDRTEAASLPFAITGAQERYFISWIDRAQLPPEKFPFEIGDEVVTFGPQATVDVVRSLRNVVGDPNPEANELFAQVYMTNRFAARSLPVPKGGIELGIKPKLNPGTVQKTTLQWTYEPEVVARPQDPGLVSAMNDEVKPESAIPDFALRNSESVFDVPRSQSISEPFWFSPQFSPIPPLGKVIWETGRNPTDDFHAYIAEVDGKKVGYIRIASFQPKKRGSDAIKQFEAIIQKLEAETDSMVIDEIYNNGGNLFYIYALARYLSPKPLKLLRVHYKISSLDVTGAQQFLLQARNVKSDADAVAVFGPDLLGYPVTLSLVEKQRVFVRNLISYWQKGETLTPLIYHNVDVVDPHPSIHYTKPIVILTNPMSISAADYFPALMQDNGRAVVFGEHTNGAGATRQKDAMIYNEGQINSISMSTALFGRGERDIPIENLAVQPNRVYKVTPHDLQNRYQGYCDNLIAYLSEISGGGRR